jgi:predicted ATPase
MAAGPPHRVPGTLPPQTSGFVGRAAELGRVRGLLRRSRLVTVTGPGGVGKTRLAVHAAGQAADDFPDGIHFIELSAVRDPGLLVHTLAAGLTVAGPASPEPDQGSQLDRLLAFLRQRELLLILDTCEHLVDGCAALADTVLREAPGVTILATSRQPLDAAGEATFQLRPLPVPAPDSGVAGTADAVELFAQRAAAAAPGFTVTPENLGDVIMVCQRLDGIPLAIELATVRLRALPLHQMAERIDDRLRLLTGGRRSGTPRHQTLRATVEWSYSLCTPAEQLLWARLSVFAGDFDTAAAEAVCRGGGLAADEIVPAVISLVDKNVLTRGDGQDDGGAESGRPAPAFRMLNTLREFGAERLRQAGPPPGGPQASPAPPAALPAPAAGPFPGVPPLPEPSGRDTGRRGAARGTIARRATGQRGAVQRGAVQRGAVHREAESVGQAEAAVRRRFIAHYLALAERFEQAPATGQAVQYQRLRREHANLRAAFDYALGLPGNDGAAIVLATSLFVYWQISGLLREGEYWLDQALDRCPRGSVVRARVLGTRGYVRVLLGDFALGRADAVAAAAMAATFCDVAAGGRGYSALHRAHAFTGNLAEAQGAAQSAAACLTAAGDSLGLAQLDVVDAMAGLQSGEPDRCRESAARGLARLPGEELWCTASLHTLLALGLFLGGDIDAATPAALRALELKHQLGDVIGTAFGLGTLAFIAAGEGRYARTAWLLGASAPLWERTAPWYTGAPAFESLHQAAERVARASLGDDRFWQLRAAGADALPDVAVERALDDLDQFGAPAPAADPARPAAPAGSLRPARTAPRRARPPAPTGQM